MRLSGQFIIIITIIIIIIIIIIFIKMFRTKKTHKLYLNISIHLKSIIKNTSNFHSDTKQ